MFCFHNLSLQILKETYCTLLQNESEKHSLNLLDDFTCILLNRFRNPTEAQAFLLETLCWSRNNSFNIAFFKLVNWYYLHRERNKIKQSLQEYTAIKQELGMKEKDSVIEYIECFTEPLQHKRPSIAYFHFLTSTGQPERAYCISRSISDSLSKPQYLNMLFDFEKYQNFIIACPKSASLGPNKKIAFAQMKLGREPEDLNIQPEVFSSLLLLPKKSIDEKMQLLLQHPNIPVSIDAKEFLFTRASSTNDFNHLRQMIQIWEICSFTPKMFKFMVRFYCIQNSLELAYYSASQFCLQTKQIFLFQL